MRAALAATPENIEVATRVARRAIDASRATGDPRFLGQAQAALSPWWAQPDAPPAVVLLRATIRQSQHDFDGALADLDRLLKANPRAAQARLTRATVLTVVGRFAEAKSDARNSPRWPRRSSSPACMAAPSSLSGDAAPAYSASRRVSKPRAPIQQSSSGHDIRRPKSPSDAAIRLPRAALRGCPRPRRE